MDSQTWQGLSSAASLSRDQVIPSGRCMLWVIWRCCLSISTKAGDQISDNIPEQHLNSWCLHWCLGKVFLEAHRWCLGCRDERQLQSRQHRSPSVPSRVAAEAWPDSTHSVQLLLSSDATIERKWAILLQFTLTSAQQSKGSLMMLGSKEKEIEWEPVM